MRAIVSRARELKRQGLTIDAVAQRLKDEGWKTQKGSSPDRSTVAKYTRGLCPQIRVVR
ncbi:MAG: hypothetical protein NWF14_05055 [Candidatus Bathyarchaeota archaeon]|jgi:hypothetical protein|nr:hypothetical protein [Candidatus Bathyarchaeota archaeon]MCW4025885.1 hypothetical protein [Candidatus Bathyarchaeota archaeon]